MRREDYISDAEVVKRANAAVRLELEKLEALDIPAVICDGKSKKLYYLYSDGSRTEVE